MPDAPAEVLGLSMRSVEDAIVIRDAGVDDRELAIKGWFSPVPPISCPAPATWPVTPVEPNCPDQWVVLMARPEVITTVEANGFVGGLPKGPSIQIDLDDLDMTWQPRLPDLGPAHPVEVVVIGHFDDRRAFACPAAVAAACRDRFVVDRVDRVGGIEQPTSEVVEVAAPRSRQADIESIVNAESPDGRVLSIVVVDGETGIGRIEPALGSGAGGFIDAAATWTIRVLEGDRAVTYLVVDGSDAIFEMTADNMPVQVGGGSAASPDASWPPDGVVDVPMPEGGSGLTRRAGVVDRTGLLVEARAASVNDPRWAHRELQEGEMAIVQITPDTIAAYWNGTLCDDRLVLTVSGDRSSDPPDRLELRGESADRCRLALVHYGMVLQFSQPVDAASMQGSERIGMRLGLVDGALDPAGVETRYAEAVTGAS
jgi:hypothetical protein